MKKRLLALVILSMMLVSALGGSAQALESYGDDGHRHYTYCDRDPDVCLYCGLTTADGADVYIYHNNSGETIQHDADEHWQACSACGKRFWSSSHYAYCDAPDACEYCGAAASECTTFNVYHNGGHFEHNADEHWKVCDTCGETIWSSSHFADCDKDACTDCGRPVAECTYVYYYHGNTHYEYNDDAHWQVCERCGNPTSSWTSQHDANSDLTACATCGAPQKKINMAFEDSGTGYQCTLFKNGTVSIAGLGEVTASNLTIPSKIQGHTVVALEHKYWSDLSSLTKVVIPTTIQSIEPDVFEYQTVLTVTKGSYAETYAKDQGLQYVVRGEEKTILSGATTVADKVKEIVHNLISNDMTDYQKALALHNYLTNTSQYDQTYTYYYEDGILLRNTGVCQSYTYAYRALLDEVGIENKYEYGDNHIWNLVKIDGKWCHVDVTWDDPLPNGYEQHDFFAITDFALEGVRSHERENRDVNPVSNSYEVSYAYKNGLLDSLAKAWAGNLQEQLAQGEYSIVIPVYGYGNSGSYGINARMAMEMIQDRGLEINSYTIRPTMRYSADSGDMLITFTINPILRQPADAVASAAGDTVTTALVPAGGGLQYQWYYKNPSQSKYTKSSVTGPSYSCTMTEEKNGRQVYCQVTMPDGTKVKSDVATLTLAAAVSITAQPSDVTVVAGKTATFKVSASGTGLTYQWYYQKPGETTWNACKSNGKSASYSVTTEARHNGYSYRCELRNSEGGQTYSRAALLKVDVKPAITTQPADKSVAVGGTATFKVTASGTNQTYQWYYRKPGETAWNACKNNGTSASYTVTAEARHNGYSYRCKVSNAAGSVTSSAATLTVIAKPTITAQPAAASVAAGQTATFSVSASGTGLTYQWYYKKSGETTWNACKNNGASASYTVTAEARHNGYSYRCKVSNSAGSVTSSAATLTVIAKPTITAQPAAASVAAGQTATFSVSASGTGLTYQWYYKKSGETTWNACKNNGASASYTVTAEARHNGYSYRCKVSNAAGSVTSSAATLTVLTKPAITAQPSSATVTKGSTATFTVSASGTGLTYQWYYKKPGETAWNACSNNAASASYSVVTAARHNGYSYRCVITNAAGSVTSSTATLTVE